MAHAATRSHVAREAAAEIILLSCRYSADDSGSWLIKLALKCAQCAMYCLQKSIEFVSYYGYVYACAGGKDRHARRGLSASASMAVTPGAG